MATAGSGDRRKPAHEACSEFTGLSRCILTAPMVGHHQDNVCHYSAVDDRREVRMGEHLEEKGERRGEEQRRGEV